MKPKELFFLLGLISLFAWGICWTQIQSPSQAFLPIIRIGREAAILQSTLEEQSKKLSYRSVTLEKSIPTLPEKTVIADIAAIVQFATFVPDTLQTLRNQMDQLHYALLEQKITALDSKFTYWGMEYDAAIQDASDLHDSVGVLKKSGGKLSEKQKALDKPSHILNNLTLELTELHVRFQIIANILEIFRNSGFKIMPAPDRILGETYEEHCKRTGHCGVADPMNPSKIFQSHAIYAIQDKNPKHDVWACEATILDFLQGRVKGQEHPYENSSSIPFCFRCHAKRKGTHNFPWCVVDNSHELVRACTILEETSNTPKK